MITKDHLLEALKASLTNEDDFLQHFSKGIPAQIEKTPDLLESEKVTIINLLSSLVADTERHKRTVLELIDSVKKDSRDAF